MPGAEANRRHTARVNEPRAVALRHVLESARYHGKAGTEARAVGGLLRVGGSPTGWPTDRRFAAATELERDQRTGRFGRFLSVKSSNRPLSNCYPPILLPNWANGDGISSGFLFRLLRIGGMRDCRWTVRRSRFRLEFYVAFPSDTGFRKMVDDEPIYDTRVWFSSRSRGYACCHYRLI
jgi:hypothetical protein